MLKIIQAVLMVMLLASASITNGEEWEECLERGWLCGRTFVWTIDNELNTLPRQVTVKCFFPGREYLKGKGQLPVKIMFHPTLKKIPNPLLAKLLISQEGEEEVPPHRPFYKGTIYYGSLPGSNSREAGFCFRFGKKPKDSSEWLHTFGFKQKGDGYNLFLKGEVFD